MPPYPLDSPFRIRDPRFADVLGPDPRLELVAEVDAHEGPVHVADEDALYFTTVRRDRVAIERLDLATGVVTVVRADANTANGMTLDREGRLVVCEQGTPETPARITRLDRTTGAWETLADAYDGRPLNSPNDVVVSRNGAVWFTDPSYGHLQGFRPTRSRSPAASRSTTSPPVTTPSRPSARPCTTRRRRPSRPLPSPDPSSGHAVAPGSRRSRPTSEPEPVRAPRCRSHDQPDVEVDSPLRELD